MTRNQANLVLLLAGAMWGMGFVAQSTAMANLGPYWFVGLRFVLATLAILPFSLLESRKAKARLDARSWLVFCIIGVVLFLGIVAQQIGLLYTSVTHSGFLTGLYVVMTPLLGIVMYRQWPHAIVWPAAVCALCGIWLLSGGGAVSLGVGDWLTILCAALWALQLVLIGRYVGDSGRPITLAVTQFAVCALLGIVAAIVLEPFDWPAVRAALPEIVYAGVFSGGAAFTLQIIGQRYTTAPQAAVFLSTEAVFAALFGAVFLGERLPPAGILGCAFIFTAILTVELLPAMLRRRRLRSDLKP